MEDKGKGRRDGQDYGKEWEGVKSQTTKQW